MNWSLTGTSRKRSRFWERGHPARIERVPFAVNLEYQFGEDSFVGFMIHTEKLQKFMKQIEARKGRFTLFGVFLREDSPAQWDLVLAAPWLENGKLKALGEFVKQMSKTFGQDEVMSFSRIVTLNHDDPALRAILSEIGSLKKPLEKQGHDLFGLPIEHAVILRAAQPKAA